MVKTNFGLLFIVGYLFFLLFLSHTNQWLREKLGYFSSIFTPSLTENFLATLICHFAWHHAYGERITNLHLYKIFHQIQPSIISHYTGVIDDLGKGCQLMMILSTRLFEPMLERSLLSKCQLQMALLIKNYFVI